MKHRGLKTEGQERFKLDPQGEKMPENITNYNDRFQAASVFFAEMIKGNATARWALYTTELDWNQPCKNRRKAA